MTKSDTLVLDITPQVLLKAYGCGIFPMAESADDPGLFWIEPERRGILPLDALHIPRRLARTVRQGRFRVTIDTAFEETLDACAAPTASRRSTWISQRIKSLYGALHEMGHAHSIEIWQEGQFVGGLYGVRLRAAFFGESMVSHARDASKIALIHLAARLRRGGFQLLDAQFLTDHLAQFGTIEIPRRTYQQRLEEALRHDADFYALPTETTGAEVLSILKTTDPSQ